VELQREYDWIVTLPPSAFASTEMLDWLRKDLNSCNTSNYGDTDSDLGLELSLHCEDDILAFSSIPESNDDSRSILLPDQIHPSLNCSTDPSRSSSTGSSSSGFFSDIQSLKSPEPMLPAALPKKMKRVVTRQASSSPPAISSCINSWNAEDQEDCNSDTGLSLNSSGGEEHFQLDTLV